MLSHGNEDRSAGNVHMYKHVKVISFFKIYVHVLMLLVCESGELYSLACDHLQSRPQIFCRFYQFFGDS